jgi:anti-anti-sigma factor
MHLTVAEHDRAVVITIEGEFLGALHGSNLRDAIAALRARGRVNVVLDLRSSTMMDSAGLGALIEAATGLRADGGDLRVAVREGRLRRLFVMTGLLGRAFTVYESVPPAVDSFAHGAAGDGALAGSAE